jgi:hypothetical protein
MLDSKASPLRLFSAVLSALVVVFGVSFATDLVEVPTSVAQAEMTRRVHAPYFSDGIFRWERAGIFWFGRVDPPGSPGQNYVDARIGYTAEQLRIYVNVEDYYVWYQEGATPVSDLTQYDGVAVYLDTANDGAPLPQPDDYLLLSGLCVFGCSESYRRGARGTGSGWDFEWDGAWATSNTSASWSCNPGPNDNTCDIDFGWWTVFDIPWSALGLSGPPSQDTIWGLGVTLYDRDDQPPAGYVAPQHWPETFDAGNPSTWGELAFGMATYTPQPARPQGTTTIRRGFLGSVEDAWVGGGGTCSGGHEGDPEHDNFGGDTSLFAANQYLIADFPCFSKSYLRFDLDPLPAGKSIISASLTLHHWGNANPDDALPSLIWLFTVDGGWEEYGLTWNNAPLAQENLTTTWVDVCTEEDPCDYPGVRYDWDATQAVAEAYAAGVPLDVALYTADWNFHSSKYFHSSEVADWIAEGRPALTVVWGATLSTVRNAVSPAAVSSGEAVTYTLSWLGTGQALTLTAALPPQVGAPGTIQTLPVDPPAVYDLGTHRVTWSGSPGSGEPVTVTFPVTVQVSGPTAVSNTAMLSDSEGLISTDTAVFIVDARQFWLPLVLRNE